MSIQYTHTHIPSSFIQLESLSLIIFCCCCFFSPKKRDFFAASTDALRMKWGMNLTRVYFFRTSFSFTSRLFFVYGYICWNSFRYMPLSLTMYTLWCWLIWYITVSERERERGLPRNVMGVEGGRGKRKTPLLCFSHSICYFFLI